MINLRYVLNVSERIRFKRVGDGPTIVHYHVPLSDYGDTQLTTMLDDCFYFIGLYTLIATAYQHKLD